MSGLTPDTRVPTGVVVHAKSRVLELQYADGATYRLPFELMRVYSPSAEVAGHGPGQETLQTGKPGGTKVPDPFMDGTLEKPVIAAVNGFAMGGGFMLVERTDLRVAVPEAVFEVSEAKRWLLGGYNHGHVANLPYPIAMEMALGFRFTAQRFYEVGFLNRIVSDFRRVSRR